MNHETVLKIIHALAIVAKVHLRDRSHPEFYHTCVCMTQYINTVSYEDHFIGKTIDVLLNYDAEMLADTKTVKFWSDKVNEVLGMMGGWKTEDGKE